MGLAGQGRRDTHRRQRAGAGGESSTMGRPQAGWRGPSLGGQCPAAAGAVLGAQRPLRPTPSFSPKTRVSSCVLLRNDPGALTARARLPCFRLKFSRRTRPLSPTVRRWALPCGLRTLHALLPEPGRQPRPGRGGDRLAPPSGARPQAWASARGQHCPVRPQQAAVRLACNRTQRSRCILKNQEKVILI